ncbi:nucleoid-associated protein [Rhizosphaericola mali]|uniref:Nucleoid-associated protein n=1 Tax=Rhizosphaericola mali TaxID=2545455 RepID=A0A5P2FYU0_9BACT|nr:nucleoid-associated protein [Rhizosphaericola mali]QES87548.1 nucleoid-associated protein [Rhizosphaericola mali]
MTGTDRAIIEKVIVHKVGNPSRGEELKLSQNPLTLNDDLVKSMLSKYFLGAFNENDRYHFTHLNDIELNEVYNYATHIFEKPDDFLAYSALIAQFLYSKSTHVKVKEGELYVALFDKIWIEEDELQAIGIFKSESKETFLKVFPHGTSYEVVQEEGVNINKLDKGCLILRKEKENGYVCLALDATNKNNEAQYWIKDFLQLESIVDSYHSTDDYLTLCKQFITEEFPSKFEVSKSDQIDLMNRSMEYFKTEEKFNIEQFAENVINHEDVIDSFKDFKSRYESSKDIALEDDFDIHLSAVKKQNKNFKSVLKLDNNFIINIHSRRDLMEKGIDEATGHQYYKFYYDEEK